MDKRPYESSEYNSWESMMSRCYRETDIGFKYYGGRGITVCDRWRETYKNFLADMGDKPTPHHSLERIDVNKGYNKENCKWSSPKEQALNRRSNSYLTFDGKTMTKSQWAEHLGLHKSSLENRIRRGWPIEKILGQRNKHEDN